MKNLEYEILVLGLGNLLMGDDGLGCLAVAELQKKFGESPNVLLLEAGGGIINYLGDISKCSKLIAIDAVHGGREPGTIYRLKGIEDGRWEDSHGFSLGEAVSLARELTGWPKEVVIYGVETLTVASSVQLSPLLAGVLPLLVEKVSKEIEQGINLALYKADR